MTGGEGGKGVAERCPWAVSFRPGAGAGPCAGGCVHPSPSPSPAHFQPPAGGGTQDGVVK